jgi:GH43 family beta-xylosidase
MEGTNILKRQDIQIRDPFVVVQQDSYYLYGSTDKNIWRGSGAGFDMYTSLGDMDEFEGPFPAFRPPMNFWSKGQFWAPEVHQYRNEWYMFATFKPVQGRRGTAILKSTGGSGEQGLYGPFAPWSQGPVTPPEWECLDGTLYVDARQKPWMVFCHEWSQAGDGEIYAMPLSDDLKSSAGKAALLFRASEAVWTHPLPQIPFAALFKKAKKNYVTDGPFLFQGNNSLFLLWSSVGKGLRYLIGAAKSESGTILGPWIQDPEPLFAADGGHGMLFRSHQGKLLLAIHAPNRTPRERAIFIEIEERDGWLRQKKEK